MDRITPEQRSSTMRAIRSKDMKPEMLVRRLVHSMGYRYRLHNHRLPGRPDMVFQPRRKVIFVHGCFWHQHPGPECKIAHRPRTNLEYWEPKLRRTQERDAATLEKYAELGWGALVIWECETKNADLSVLKYRLRAFLDG